MGCGKKGYYVRDCRSKNANAVKGIETPKDGNSLKGIRGYLIKHFAFYYNNACLIYKDAKYGVSF